MKKQDKSSPLIDVRDLLHDLITTGNHDKIARAQLAVSLAVINTMIATHHIGKNISRRIINKNHDNKETNMNTMTKYLLYIKLMQTRQQPAVKKDTVTARGLEGTRLTWKHKSNKHTYTIQADNLYDDALGMTFPEASVLLNGKTIATYKRSRGSKLYHLSARLYNATQAKSR